MNNIDRVYAKLLGIEINTLEDAMKTMREAYKKLVHIKNGKQLLKQNLDAGLDSVDRLIKKLK